MTDIDIVVADSLKVLDLKWPIREADLDKRCRHFADGPRAELPDANAEAAELFLRSTRQSASMARVMG